MEHYEQRYKRFSNGEPEEIIRSYLEMFWNCFITTELQKAYENQQTGLLLIGIQSVIATLTEGIWGKTGKDSIQYYLERYVDQDESNKKFSKIADIIHELRNGHMHRLYTRIFHHVVFDYTLDQGWKFEDEKLYFNLNVYFDCFKQGYPRPYDLKELHLTPEQAIAAKKRLLKEFDKGSDALKQIREMQGN
jgi:hypothetical protein